MDEIYKIPLFEGIPKDEMQWLLANSQEKYLAEGDFFVKEDEPAEHFYIVLEGELQVTRMLNGQATVLGTTPRGIMGGELALLYGTPSNVTSRAILPSRLMVFDQKAFREIFTVSPLLGSRILQTTVERTQGFASIIKQQEKLAALGKFSAGLAHELNNPAAAAQRASKTLRQTLAELQIHTIQLNSLGLDQDKLQDLASFQQEAAARLADVRPLPPLEQSDREAEIGDWLEEQGISNGWDMSAGFVSARVTQPELGNLVVDLSPESAGVVLAWLSRVIEVYSLLEEIEQSTVRISDLVSAVKAYTFMDQATVQDVDIHKGIENTLTVMNHKLKNVTVIREYDPGLSKIRGRGSDLNQVWTNLIDNAVDAMGGQGTIWVTTRSENDYVMVEVTDDGPGIPPEILPHLFEPFFTTKDVGIGTGLGLDISYRIIRQHNGTIEVRPESGRTRFIVRLPVGYQ